MLLGVSRSGIYQAFTIPGVPIYCTQFHPELDLQAFFERVRQYPEYVEKVHNMPVQEFVDRCEETPEANQLLRRFIREFFS